jgi:type IV secretory pathway component VirB8
METAIIYNHSYGTLISRFSRRIYVSRCFVSLYIRRGRQSFLIRLLHAKIDIGEAHIYTAVLIVILKVITIVIIVSCTRSIATVYYLIGIDSE